MLASDARPLGTLPPGVAAALPPFHKPFDFVPNQSEELTCGVAAWRHGLPPGPTHGSKSAAVIALLQREQGATLAEMIEATGWLPHTTRAALTGLKK